MGTQNPAEELLDEAIEATFPASDPIAVEDAYARQRRRLRRREDRRQAQEKKTARPHPAPPR